VDEFSASCIIEAMPTAQDATTLATLERVGTALADPTRCRILVRLLAGAAYPAELADALGAGRSNISNHLACLRGCGLVRATREGRQVRYELASDRLAHAIGDLISLELHVEPGHEGLGHHG
jgi:ArsR family transcriptional regulator, cadmium/lead-responsive transcriptional repressor